MQTRTNSIFLKSRHYLLPAFLLVSGWAPILMAASDHHSQAPAFSDPTILAPVPDGWELMPVEYSEKYRDADLVIALGQQSHPLFHDLILDYAKANRLNIVIEQGTCGITSGRLLKKKVDVGAFCCPPGKNDRLPGLKFYSFGISPIALIVNPANTLSNVSSEQARKIFSGEISRWSEIDPDNSHLIQPVGRLHCKTRPGHWRALLNSGDEFSPRLFEVGVIADMLSQVSKNAGSIGWETPLMVNSDEKKGEVKMLSIDGHLPYDIENIVKGNYPLYRSYSLSTWSKEGKSNKQAIKLIHFLQENVEKSYKEYGFIPISLLKKAGWKFADEELVGEPVMNQQARH